MGEGTAAAHRPDASRRSPEPQLGRRSFLVGAGGATVGAAVASMLGGSVEAATPLSIFEPTVPSVRLADTRPEYGSFGFTRVDANTIRVSVRNRRVGTTVVPGDAVAAVLSVAASNSVDARSFVTAYPSKTARPNTANMNLSGLFDLVNNLITVKLGSDGALELFTRVKGELIVDLVGVYRPAGGATRGGRFEPLGGLGGAGPSAQRIFSPELSGVPRSGQVVDIDVESLISSGLIERDATALAVNLAVARPANRGRLVAYPYGEAEPDTSSLNYLPGSVRSNNSIVRLGTHPRTGRRGFHIMVLTTAPVYVDVAGFFTGENARFSTTAGQFVAITPTRILDTRSATPAMRGVGGGKRLWPGWTRQFTLPPSIAPNAGAVAVNLTIVEAMAPGFVTLYPAKTPRYVVSNGNAYLPNQIVGNHNIVRTGTEGLEVYSRSGASMVCDLVGYYQGSGVAPSVTSSSDPPPPPAAPPYSLNMPYVGRALDVRAGTSSTAVVDSGRVWHWTGTGLVGQGAPIGTFAHRTDAGGPYRNVHFLKQGDRLTLDTVDQRRYTYEVFDRALTDSRSSKILEEAFRYDGEWLSLIACTIGFDRSKSGGIWEPTSLQYRIIVRLRLIGWEDTAPTPF